MFGLQTEWYMVLCWLAGMVVGALLTRRRARLAGRRLTESLGREKALEGRIDDLKLEGRKTRESYERRQAEADVKLRKAAEAMADIETSLGDIMADHEGTVASLTASVADRDARIATLERRLAAAGSRQTAPSDG